MHKVIDLFAGIGGIRLGFESVFDTETVFVSEWDKSAQKTYNANFVTPSKIQGDITLVPEESIPEFDICLAGFPCQAFSQAGKRRGFEDTYKGRSRGTLFAEVVRICEYRRPQVIFCENVKGLVSHDKGRTLETILGAFREIGYSVFWKVLNSKDFGVPQNRERIYIVCFRKDLAIEEFTFPVGVELKQTIRDILDPAPIPSRYYLSSTYLDSLKAHKERHAAKGNGFGYIVRDLNGISGACACGGMGREQNLVCDPREHSLIPTTHIQGEINTEDIRKMTPREWARLQGFPESYILENSDTQLYKQLGNTVTVPVISAIAGAIATTLSL